MPTIRLFDSFAGIGALHQSLKYLGVPVKLVGASEIDIDAIISYSGVHNLKMDDIPIPSVDEMRQYLLNRNVGYSFEKGKTSIPRLKVDKLTKCYKACIAMNNFGDISKIKPNSLPDFDLFNFSFPCTDISIAGRQKGMLNDDGSTTRSGLYTYGLQILKAKRPSYILIENVKGLIQKKFVNHFYDIINEIESLGYTCYYPQKSNGQPTCLNAKMYGVPQNRERIFIICIRNDVTNNNFKFPEGKDYGIRLKDLLESNVDEKYFLSDMIQERFKLNGNVDKIHNEINVVGTSSPPQRTIGQRDTTYGTNGVIGALTATDYKQPKQIISDTHKIIVEGNTRPSHYTMGKVLNTDGISCTILDNKGTQIVDSSNLNEINKIYDIPKDILKDNERQRRVYNDKGISPSILARSDSAKIIDNELKFIGGIGGKRLEDGKAYSRNYTQGNRVYDSNGICATLTALGGGIGGNTGLYQVNKDEEVASNDIVQLNNPKHSQQRIYSPNGIAPTICAGNNGGGKSPCKHITPEYKIRKLTPTETWLLMGFKKEHINSAIELGISNSALYKQAGNSIVVNVLYYIFKELFKKYIIE